MMRAIELPQTKTIEVECEESFEATTNGNYDGPIGTTDECGFLGEVEATLDGDFYEFTCPRCGSMGFTDAEPYYFPEGDS